MRDAMREFEDWLMDQPMMLAIPIIFVGLLALCGVVLLAGAGAICALGGCKPADPYFYENGMRCRWNYYLVGKVTMAQKNCVELPQMTPIVERIS